MKLNIIHTNDVHSNVRDFAKVSHYINKVREENEYTLVMDAGDLVTGEYQFNTFRGDLEVEIVNKIGYDCLSLGNHEFDNGVLFCKEHMSKFDTKFTQSNILNPQKELTNYERISTFNINNHIIKVLAITCPYVSYNIENPPMFESLDESIKLIKDTAKECDHLILLSHQGLKVDIELANLNLPIDIIIGAHTHDIVEDNFIINDTLIVQTGSFLENLGHIEWGLDAKTKGSKKIKLDEYDYEEVEVKKIIDTYEGKLDIDKLKVYGVCKSKLIADRFSSLNSQTNFGTLICDSYFYHSKLNDLNIDIAMINSKGIRQGINPGNITDREIYNALPFSKKLIVFDVLGVDIVKAIETNFIDVQVRGIKIIKQRLDDGVINKIVNEDETDFDLNKTYKIMTVDYVFNSPFFTPFNLQEIKHTTSMLDTDILKQYISTLDYNFEYKSNNNITLID